MRILTNDEQLSIMTALDQYLNQLNDELLDAAANGESIQPFQKQIKTAQRLYNLISDAAAITTHDHK